MATTVCKFSGGAYPQTLLEPFFILSMLQNNSARKNTLENMTVLGAPSLKKILKYAADMKTLSKGFLRLFWV